MKTKIITESAIMTSLSVVFLFIASISPVNKIFIGMASALVLEIFIKRHKVKLAMLVFIPTCLLGFFILPFKMIVILYITIFGGYSMLRNSFSMKNHLLKKIFMIVYFNIVLFSLFIFANQIFEELFNPIINGPFWQNMMFFFVIQLAVLLYDYALELASRIIKDKLSEIGF